MTSGMDYGEEVVTQEEQQYIINWVTKNKNNSFPLFIYNRLNGCYFMFIEDLLKETSDNLINKNVYEILTNIKNRIESLENLKECKTSSELGNLIYIMDSGKKLHKHIDVNDIDSYHIRFNVIIQNPEQGGVPIYAEKKIKTKERCYIICRSGLDYHETTVVSGNKPKIIISYGYSIDKNKISLYSKIFKKKFTPPHQYGLTKQQATNNLKNK
jgi:hypothetical protein